MTEGAWRTAKMASSAQMPDFKNCKSRYQYTLFVTGKRIRIPQPREIFFTNFFAGEKSKWNTTPAKRNGHFSSVEELGALRGEPGTESNQTPVQAVRKV